MDGDGKGAHRYQQAWAKAHRTGEITGQGLGGKQWPERKALCREEKGSTTERGYGENGDDPGHNGDGDAEHTAADSQNECQSGGGPRAAVVPFAGPPANNKLARPDDVSSERRKKTERGPAQPKDRSRRGVGSQQRSLDQVTGIPGSKDERVRQHLERQSPHAYRFRELVHQ
jgi:hypothetical protein